MEVLERFKSDHELGMEKFPNRFMVLLVDCDGRNDRLAKVKAVIPDHLTDRVFVLGVWTEPEDLKGDYEAIGKALAKDCREGTSKMWDDPLLKRNAAEAARLRERVWPILFAALQ